MARKTKQGSPAKRRAAEAARRAAAAQRVGPRTPRPPRQRTLKSLNPPGMYYEEWDKVGSRVREHGTEAALAHIAEEHGTDSGLYETAQTFFRYADLYGTIPTQAVRHLELTARSCGLAGELAAAQGLTEEEVLNSLHELHAAGFLLVADDGRVWATIPPGTPESAPGGQWAFVEPKFSPVPAS